MVCVPSRCVPMWTSVRYAATNDKSIVSHNCTFSRLNQHLPIKPYKNIQVPTDSMTCITPLHCAWDTVLLYTSVPMFIHCHCVYDTLSLSVCMMHCHDSCMLSMILVLHHYIVHVIHCGYELSECHDY